MSEKEAVKQLQDLISDFNVSNGFDVRANATDIKAIKTVLEILERVENAFIEEQIKYTHKINKAIDEMKKIKKDLDIEPWSIYKIDGSILFELLKILEE